MLELSELNCKNLKVSSAVILGNWVKNSSKYGLSTKQVYDCYLEYIKQFFQSGMPISIMLDGCFLCKKNSVKYAKMWEICEIVRKSKNYPLKYKVILLIHINKKIKMS